MKLPLFTTAALLSVSAFAVEPAHDAGVAVGPDGQVDQVVHVGGAISAPPMSDSQILDSLTVQGPAAAVHQAISPSVGGQSAQVTLNQPGSVLIEMPPQPVSPVQTAPISMGASIPEIPHQLAQVAKPVELPPAAKDVPAAPLDASVGTQVPLQATTPVHGAIMVSLTQARQSVSEAELSPNVLQPLKNEITVTPRRNSGELSLIPNPFDCRCILPAALDATEFHVTGLVWGSIPVLYCNETSLAIGDKVGGFCLYGLRHNGAIWEKDSRYFFTPIGKTTIRLPKQ
jgi:hypothetical protein